MEFNFPQLEFFPLSLSLEPVKATVRSRKPVGPRGKEGLDVGTLLALFSLPERKEEGFWRKWSWKEGGEGILKEGEKKNSCKS